MDENTGAFCTRWEKGRDQNDQSDCRQDQEQDQHAWCTRLGDTSMPTVTSEGDCWCYELSTSVLCELVCAGWRRSHIPPLRPLWPQRRHLRWWSSGAHVPAGRQVTAKSAWWLPRLPGVAAAQRTISWSPWRIIPAAATRHCIHHSRMRR